MGAHRALCENYGDFGSVPPDGQGDRRNCCVPGRRTAQILTQSRNSSNELKQTQVSPETPVWLH